MRNLRRDAARARRSAREWGARARSSRNNPAYFGRAAPRAGPAAPAQLDGSHYPLTIRNRPTSWLLDLGYNDLTSAK